MLQCPSVFVTCSSGLLGKPVCSASAYQGYEVFGVDHLRLSERQKDNDHMHDVGWRITSYENVRGGVADVRTNTDGELATVIHTVAYCTMLVHEPCGTVQRITEAGLLSARWPCPESKIETERLTCVCGGYLGIQLVILRIAGVDAEHGRQTPIVQLIKRILGCDFQSHFFSGDTAAGQSSVYLVDAVKAIVATVELRTDIEAKTAILIGVPDLPCYETLQHGTGQRIHGRDWRTLDTAMPVVKVNAEIAGKLPVGGVFFKIEPIHLSQSKSLVACAH